MNIWMTYFVIPVAVSAVFFGICVHFSSKKNDDGNVERSNTAVLWYIPPLVLLIFYQLVFGDAPW